MTHGDHIRLHMQGKPKTLESIKKRVKKIKGKHPNDEARRKMSEAHKGEKGYWYGKHLSKETRRKIGETRKEKYSGENHPLWGKHGADNPNSKPVIGTNIKTGEVVEFPNAKEAQKTLGIFSTNICMCCRGKLKSAGGWMWQYA